jgi:hypothetical protein
MSFTFPCTFRGRLYKSLISIARHFGLNRHQVYGRSRRGYSLDEIVDGKNHPRSSSQIKKPSISNNRKQGFQGKPLIVQGRRFPSLKAACKHFGVKRVTAKRRLGTGDSPEQALGLAPRIDGRRQSKSRNSNQGQKIANIQVTHLGRSYKNLRECTKEMGLSIKDFCLSYGKPCHLVYNRLRHGWPLNQALGIDSSRDVTPEN